MFDVPAQDKCRLQWKGDLPIESLKWNVGLIVGPSGCGKSTIAKQLWPEAMSTQLTWSDRSVIDDCGPGASIEQISSAFSAVGFNSIPSWLRRYEVLSNGERFRVELARLLLELPDPIVVDEFTSVVDRQVAQIGSYAVQKFARKNNRKFVAVTCHYDVVDWLQPDWILEPSTMAFTPRRSLQRRPSIDCSIQRVTYETWKLFAPFHYLNADLHKAARCFGLFVGDRITAFAGMLHRPHPKVKDIMGLSRLVTLPDWQGLGLAMILSERLGGAYKAIGKRMHTYPAHPALVRAFDKSPMWRMEKRSGVYATLTGNTIEPTRFRGFGARPCAMFDYCGPAMDADQARLLLAG